MPEKGALCVWCTSNRGHSRIPVVTPEDGARTITRIANQHLKDKRIQWNTLGLEVFENGEWAEWYSDECENVDELIDIMGL